MKRICAVKTATPAKTVVIVRVKINVIVVVNATKKGIFKDTQTIKKPTYKK